MFFYNFNFCNIYIYIIFFLSNIKFWVKFDWVGIRENIRQTTTISSYNLTPQRSNLTRFPFFLLKRWRAFIFWNLAEIKNGPDDKGLWNVWVKMVIWVIIFKLVVLFFKAGEPGWLHRGWWWPYSLMLAFSVVVWRSNLLIKENFMRDR